MKEQKILKKLFDYFADQDRCIEIFKNFACIYHGLANVDIGKKNILNLSFSVVCPSTLAAIVTQEVICFAAKNKLKVYIFEPYMDIFNEDGMIVNVLFGEDAVHFAETGEMPDKKQEDIENAAQNKKAGKEDMVDKQKKADAILDQINAKGMKSLKKNQKDFLLNYSKEVKVKK